MSEPIWIVTVEYYPAKIVKERWKNMKSTFKAYVYFKENESEEEILKKTIFAINISKKVDISTKNPKIIKKELFDKNENQSPLIFTTRNFPPL